MATKPKLEALPPTIDQLVAERDRMAEELENVRASPRPFEEALVELPDIVRLAADRFAVPTSWIAQRVGQVGAVVEHLAGQTDRAPPNAFAVACWSSPDAVAEALEADLRQVYSRLPQPLLTADREHREAELAVEIARLERQIAVAWWAAVDQRRQPDPPPVDGAVLVGLPHP